MKACVFSNRYQNPGEADTRAAQSSPCFLTAKAEKFLQNRLLFLSPAIPRSKAQSGGVYTALPRIFLFIKLFPPHLWNQLIIHWKIHCT